MIVACVLAGSLSCENALSGGSWVVRDRCLCARVLVACGSTTAMALQLYDDGAARRKADSYTGRRYAPDSYSRAIERFVPPSYYAPGSHQAVEKGGEAPVRSTQVSGRHASREFRGSASNVPLSAPLSTRGELYLILRYYIGRA